MLLGYSGIFAKIKAMQGYLLKDEDYLNLALLPSVRDIGEQIKEIPSYRNVFKDLSEVELKREPLERKLKFTLYNEFAKIYNFITNTGNSKYLNAYSKKFEIDILKLLLRAVLDERDINYALPESNLLLRNRINIDIQKLLNSNNIPEFINNTEGTEYYKVLSTVYKANPTLFAMEMQLDLYYYLQLWKAQNKLLDTKNQKLQAYTNGTDIDLHNILWIYRAKKYYNSIEESTIFTYMIPIHYKLSQSDLTKLVTSKTIEGFFDVISKTYYSNFFQDMNKMSSDEIYRNYMKKIQDTAANLNPYSLSIATTYIYKKELEVKNITSLIEGKRYSLEKNDILKHIIFPGNSSNKERF